MGDQPIARLLPTHRTTQTQNERTQTTMPPMGFEPMISVLDRAKAVHSLNRAATMIGFSCKLLRKYFLKCKLQVSIVFPKFLLTCKAQYFE
jgi:hypothetical protein